MQSKQESKSIRVRTTTEKRLVRFIKKSKKKVYKLHFASDAIEKEIDEQEKQKQQSK